MAELELKAFVARTSHDQNHLNRLTVPEWGVVEIRLIQGGNGSLSHRLPGAATPRMPTGAGADSFNFAPGPQLNPTTWAIDPARKDRPTVWYDLHNPFLNITKAKLEIFRRFDEDPIFERELKDEELWDGPHQVAFGVDSAHATIQTTWAGYVKESKRFPDGYLTVEHSPYKLKITVEGPGQSSAQVAWTYFHVLIHHLELEWGFEDAISSSDAQRRQPFHDLLHPRVGPAPTPLTPNIKIYLNSAIFGEDGWFYNHSDDWFDNTLYKQYKKMWGDGPEIPLFCKIWIKDSSGAPVLAPGAIGNTKFLWDWESRSAAVPSAFATNAQNYDVAATNPSGQNCHDDRGGKRGGSDSVFPERKGYDPTDDLDSNKFPFKVEGCGDPRSWASYSYAWREKKLAAKTGVLFQPSRMAGDKYRVTVYAAVETTDGQMPRIEVDAAAPIPIDASLKAVTGDFEIWRRVSMIRYIQKTLAVAPLAFPAIAAYYQPAFLDLVDDSGGPVPYPQADWNTNLADAISDWSSKEQFMVDPAVNQYTSGNDGAFLRTPAQFHAAFVADGNTPAEATQWMNNNGMSNISTYSSTAEGLVRKALIEVFNERFRDDIDGVNVSQVSVVHNRVAAAAAAGPYTITDGEAANYKKADRNHCAFLSLLDPVQRASIGFASTSEITAAHEFGHHFCLPHPAPVNGESGYNAHDTTVGNCVMSYSAGVRVFCGLCQLRLRGWDKDALKTTPINNRP